LGKCGNSETVAKLEPLLKDGQAAVRLMAAASIVRLTNPPSWTPHFGE
jgi:hypothetical protein